MTSRFLPLTYFQGTPGNDYAGGALHDPNTFTGFGLGFDALVGGRMDDIFGFSLVDGRLDVVIGGGGQDTVDYSAVSLAPFSDHPLGLMINLTDGTTRAWYPPYAAGTQQILTDIENVVGTQWNDFITGNNEDNVLEGGRGADILVGGGGSDTASYEHSRIGVRVALDGGDPGGLRQGDATGDVLISIENLTGSDYGDVFYGDSADNTFDGRGGSDRVSYLRAGDAIEVDLREGTVRDLDEVTGLHTVGHDTLISIEQIEGTRFDDVYYASDSSDVFVFGMFVGNDNIYDFNADVNDDDHDLIHLEGWFKTWDELSSHIQRDGDDWTVTLDQNNSITLYDVDGTLNENDFVLV